MPDFRGDLDVADPDFISSAKLFCHQFGAATRYFLADPESLRGKRINSRVASAGCGE
jgi:hypothetical protein